MGAGVLKAGDLWAGHELPAGAVVPLPLTMAPAYDPTTRAIPYDADGRAQQVHWVDQTVAVLLSVAQGSIAAAPDVGTDRAQLKRATTANVQTVVDDVVRQALGKLLAQAAITILRIEVAMSPARGLLAYDVTYRNNLLADSLPRTLTLS